MFSVAPRLKPLLPPRWWWIALLAIVVIAGAFRYTGYNFSLPYIDHPDEPAQNIAARMVIDFGSPKPIGMQGYPPGIIAVNYVLLRLFHNPATPPSNVLGMVRLISITFNLGALVMVALLAYRVASSGAGLLAALLWAVNTNIIEFSRYGTPDNFVTFFTLLGLFLGLTAAFYDRDRWATWGVVAMMLAVIFKYQAIFVLPLVLVLPLLRLIGAPAGDRGRILRNFAVNVGWLLLFSFWLIFLYPSLEAGDSPAWSAAHPGIPTPAVLFDNFALVAAPMKLTWIALPAVAGLILAMALRPRAVSLIGLGALLLAGLMWHVGVSLWGVQAFRQFVSVAALVIVFLGVGLGEWLTLLARLLGRLAVAPALVRQRALVSGLIIGIVTGVLLIPQVQSSIANAYDHTLPDQRNDLARYMDTSLTPAPYIADISNHKTLDGAWGGYAGIHSFDFKGVGHLDEKPMREWQAEGVVYDIESYGYYQDLLETTEGRALLDQTVLLKSYPPSSHFRGPSMVVLRVGAIQHLADGALGPIHLMGYDLDRDSAAPGATFSLTLYWRADAATDADEVVYNHLVDASGKLIAQIDGDPLPDLRRPTSTWNDPTETLISRPFTLTIPVGTPPGQYRLITGFYRRDNGARLTSPDGHDSLTVTMISVAP